MCGSRTFCQRGGPTSTVFISFIFSLKRGGGGKNQNTTISRQSSALQRNAIQMAFRWRVDDGPTLKGLVAL